MTTADESNKGRPKREPPPTGSIMEQQYASVGGRPRPLDRATVPPSQRGTARPLNSDTVSQLDSGTVGEKQEKTSFYLSATLLEKLDDLAHDYRKASGHRVNRNDIVRHLVEGCSLESLTGLKPLERSKK